MDERKLLVCPGCEIFCSDNRDSKDYKCPKCGGIMYDVPIAYEAYAYLNEDDKRQVREEYISKHFGTVKQNVPPFVPMKQSRMAGFVGIMGALAFGFAFVAGAVIVATTGSIGAGIGVFVGCTVSGSILYVMSNIANDIRQIRNQIDRLVHERNRR